MLQRKDFWVGVALGVVAYYVYTTHLKGKGAS